MCQSSMLHACIQVEGSTQTAQPPVLAAAGLHRSTHSCTVLCRVCDWSEGVAAGCLLEWALLAIGNTHDCVACRIACVFVSLGLSCLVELVQTETHRVASSQVFLLSSGGFPAWKLPLQCR